MDLPQGSKVIILEKSNKLLSKVKISGGGRCNVTHACFEPKELIKFYPRGGQELLGPFHTFQPGDTFEWFSKKGVELKIEDDNRVFPTSDSSQTIIDCFLKEANRKGVQVLMGEGLEEFNFDESSKWNIRTSLGNEFSCDALLFTVGSSPMMFEVFKKKQIAMVEQVPSLFTFNISDKRIVDLPGISSVNARVHIPLLNIESSGPVLITHWGLSGPGILKLSAIAARALFEKNYQFKIIVNWDAQFDLEEAFEHLKQVRQMHAKKSIHSFNPFQIPSRLWLSLIHPISNVTLNWADVSNASLQAIAKAICGSEFMVNGKSTFKDEFVTAGGVDLKFINFKTMEHKHLKGVYFAGEVLNIDAVTGGFNFQAAWTTSFIAAKAIAEQAQSQKSF